LKILLIHNEYVYKGGEDSVFEAESKLLREHGHEVVELKISNKNIRNPNFFMKIKIAFGTIWSWKSYKLVKKKIIEVNPDIVHVHNTFPQFSPSIYWAIKSAKKPVVQTIHNFRLTCANALLYRENNICELCLKKSKLYSLKNRCYRNSLFATLPITLMQIFHTLIGTFNKKVDTYIALTEFSKNIMVQAGIKKEKIVVKPNFIQNNEDIEKPNYNRKKRFIYVGRISEEKGLDLLLEAFSKLRSPFELVIIGEGPEKERLVKKYQQNPKVFWLGYMSKEKVLKEIKNSYALVMPSKWYETFGMVVIEAFSVGTPVIVPNHGGFPSLVKEMENGLLFNPSDKNDLQKKLELISKRDIMEKLSKNAILSFQNNYSSWKNYKQLMQIYNKLLD